MHRERREYTAVEELMHSGIHGAGAMIFLALTAFLVVCSLSRGTEATVAAALYGASAVATFSASMLFHTAPHGSQASSVLEIFDHSAIYFMIIGTYLPIAWLVLDDAVGYLLFALCAVLSLLGVGVSVINLDAYRSVGFALYLGAALSVMLSLILHPAEVGGACALLLLAGVICYTGGVFFYKIGRARYMHAVWHALVLVGSLFHFFAILRLCYS